MTAEQSCESACRLLLSTPTTAI